MTETTRELICGFCNTKFGMSTAYKNHLKKCSKSIKTQIKKKEEQNNRFSRAFQQQYDSEEILTFHKYNFMPCADCGTNLEVIAVNMWRDPKTGKIYQRLRYACSSKCLGKRELLFRLEELTDEEKEEEEEKFQFYY